MDRLLNDLEIEVVPFARDQAALAITAYRQYGKGSGHVAALNFGDCFSYALAKLRDEPLLFKGNDFSRTDLRGCRWALVFVRPLVASRVGRGPCLKSVY